ncbi:MAG: N-6 DNA methylase [Candidatus Sericytochromatia bacterium]|nr:N-6 DNA methylase [Candidatus Tanganyikabacteria bacterium]
MAPGPRRHTDRDQALIGQVFTPPALAAEILAAVEMSPESVLDPTCGNGNFLVEAARRWPGAALAGIEADPGVAAAARERLPGARIEVADALNVPVAPEFDLVVGNPPYAAAFRDPADRARVRADHPTARGSFDLAVPFVERAIAWLRPGGWLALVVTNKLLVKDFASLLREHLLAQLALVEVWDLAAAPAFPGVAVDVAVIIGRRSPATRRPIVVLGRKDGSRERYPAAGLAVGARGRWEVYRTPAVAGILAEIEQHPRLGDLRGVGIRDGILGRAYHEVPLSDGLQNLYTPVYTGVSHVRTVAVGNIRPGEVAWDRPFKRGGQTYREPVTPVTGEFAAFCREPKVLVKGVARRLVAAFCEEPAVPMVAVRAVTGHTEPLALEGWLNSPLASFYLEVTCRSDRIPRGSYNISKAWLQELPIPDRPPALEPGARAWLAAYGV